MGDPVSLENVDRQLEDALWMGAGVRGAMEVEVDEQGVELGEADHPPRAEEAVLGEVDVVLAAKVADRVGEIADRHGGLAPAAAGEPPGEGHAAETCGMQGQRVIGGGDQARASWGGDRAHAGSLLAQQKAMTTCCRHGPLTGSIA
jgi:hypothetical protein